METFEGKVHYYSKRGFPREEYPWSGNCCRTLVYSGNLSKQ